MGIASEIRAAPSSVVQFDQVLMRLTWVGAIERAGHRRCVVPRIGDFGIKLMPTAEQAAPAAAEAEEARFGGHSAEAVQRRLGLPLVQRRCCPYSLGRRG